MTVNNPIKSITIEFFREGQPHVYSRSDEQSDLVMTEGPEGLKVKPLKPLAIFIPGLHEGGQTYFKLLFGEEEPPKGEQPEGENPHFPRLKWALGVLQNTPAYIIKDRSCRYEPLDPSMT